MHLSSGTSSDLLYRDVLSVERDRDSRVGNLSAIHVKTVTSRPSRVTQRSTEIPPPGLLSGIDDIRYTHYYYLLASISHSARDVALTSRPTPNMSSPAGDTSAAGPESRIRHLQDLILSGEDGFTCGAVIPKDILDPSKMMLYFSNAQLESQYVPLPFLPGIRVCHGGTIHLLARAGWSSYVSAMTFPPTATSLDAFMRLASPSPFGRNAETVLDAEYRNAREFKVCFMSALHCYVER